MPIPTVKHGKIVKERRRTKLGYWRKKRSDVGKKRKKSNKEAIRMSKLRIDGRLIQFSRNKQGTTTLTIKTDKLLQRDLDKLGESEIAPEVVVEFGE